MRCDQTYMTLVFREPQTVLTTGSGVNLKVSDRQVITGNLFLGTFNGFFHQGYSLCQGDLLWIIFQIELAITICITICPLNTLPTVQGSKHNNDITYYC